MMAYGVLTFVGCLLVASTAYAIVIPHKAHHYCTVQEVRYDACGKTISNGECNGNGEGFFKVSINYTMKFSSATFENLLIIYYDQVELNDYFTPGSENACKHTRCPVEAENPATFTEIVHVPKWADKDLTKFSVILHLRSPDNWSNRCMVEAEL